MKRLSEVPTLQGVRYFTVLGRPASWKQFSRAQQTTDNYPDLQLSIPAPRNSIVEINEKKVLGTMELEVYQPNGGGKMNSWQLFDEVEEVGHVESKYNSVTSMLTIELTKRKQGSGDVKDWLHPINIPLLNEQCKKFPFYSTEEIDQLLAAKLEPLPVASEPEAISEPGQLVRLAPVSSSSTNPLTVHELKRYTEEENELESKLTQLTNEEKQLSSSSSSGAPTQDLEKELERHTLKIAALGVAKGLSLEIRKRRAEPITLKNYLEVLELEFQKAMSLRGQLNIEAQESWKDDAESKLSKVELFHLGSTKMEQGISTTKNQEQSLQEGIHLLRCLAIHHHSPRATFALNDYYSRFNMVPWGSQLLLRRALHPDDNEPSTNLAVGNLHSQGHPFFPPVLPLAIFFLQRAAEGGAHSSLCRISELLLDGKPHPQTPPFLSYQPEVERGLAFLDLAVDRGIGEAYWKRFQIHGQGLYGVQADHKIASDFVQRAFDTIPTLEKQFGPQVEQILKSIK